MEAKRNNTQRITAGFFKKVEEQHVQDRDKWAFLIGQTVVIFTEIEDISLDAIERFSYPFSEFSKTLLLEKRLDLLSIIINSHEDLNDEIKKEFEKAIKNIKKISPKRNLIVHNPMRLTITSDSGGVVLSAGGIVASARNQGKKMDLPELVYFLDEARNFLRQLYDARNKANKQFRDVQEVRRKRELRRRSAASRRNRKEIANIP